MRPAASHRTRSLAGVLSAALALGALSATAAVADADAEEPATDEPATATADAAEDPGFGTVHRAADLEVAHASQGTRVMTGEEIGQDIDVLLFQNSAGPGERLTLAFEVPADAEYEISLQPLLAPSYGTYEVALDEQSPTELNLYAESIQAGSYQHIDTRALPEGRHTLTIEATGTDPLSTGHFGAFMRLAILDESDRQERLDHLLSGIDEVRTTLTRIGEQIPEADHPDDAGLRARAADHTASLDELAERAEDLTGDFTELDQIRQETEATGLAVDRLGDFVQARRQRPEAPFGIATADAMSLVYPSDLPCAACTQQNPSLSLAQGEYESIQTVLLPYTQGLADVQARVTDVRGPGDAVESDPADGPTENDAAEAPTGLEARVHPLGSVFVQNTDVVLPAMPGRPQNYEGWIPDPVRTDLTSVDLQPWVLQPYWLQLHAPAQAPPGTYTVTVEFEAAGVEAQQLEVEATVWPFEIPDRPDLATSMTTKSTDPGAPTEYSERWYMLEQVYDSAGQGEFEDLRHAYIDFLGDFKIEPDLIYNTEPPAVAELLELEERIGLRQFNVLYLPGYADREFDPEDPDSWQPEIDEILDIVGAAMAEYEDAGLAEKAYIYGFDERSDTELAQAVLGQIKAEFPDLEVMSTFMDPSLGVDSGLAEEIDIWVPGVETLDTEAMARAQQRGDEVYWYTHQAVRHPLPNWFNGYPPSDTRVLLGPLSHTTGVDGFLYYNIMRWPDREPMTDGVLSDWDPQTYETANGDGSLFYPGADGPLASQRLHNFRDGMEDFNLLNVLQQAIDRAEQHGAGEPDLARARELLSAEAIVTDQAQFTRDAGEYRAWRSEVAAMIITLQRPGEVRALVAALEGYIASGDVDGGIERPLTLTLDRAQQAVASGHTQSAARWLERFSRHLDGVRDSDTLTDRAGEDLQERATVLLTFLE
ncbi:glycoside hydrolase domain-containing protein [Ruania zhangjianzhongii]|uniref:glycoside hydrolase domain-containing protein n=1 Tax=Ruania zhangjianzhongii TaxID=2603206 RepID=UPI0011C8D817|nr:glycoside hydrolase domain-containing protein [Ruania zhangjianzhongii]